MKMRIVGRVPYDVETMVDTLVKKSYYQHKKGGQNRLNGLKRR
jgi:hypothetical protein